MKVVLTFLNINEPRLYRYIPQFKSIAKSVDELHLVYLRGKKEITINDNVTYHKVKLSNIINKIKKINPNVIYHLTHSAINNFIIYLVSKRLNIPVVCRLRGNGFKVREHNYNSETKRRFENALDKFVMKRFDVIIPISQELKDDFIDMDFKNIGEVIYNGIDTNLFYYSKLPKDFKVGYSGRIAKEKGSTFLIELIKECKDIDFIMCGAIQDENFKVFDNVEHLGYLKYSTMPYFYDRCSIVIMPSLQEGISNTLLECYAKGKPVLTTDVAQPKEFFSFYNSMELNINDWSSFLRLYKDSLNDEVYNGIRLSAREFVESLKWGYHGSKMNEQFEKVKPKNKIKLELVA